VHSEAIEIRGLTDVVQITAGFGFTCALREIGAIFCWGFSQSFALGAGDTVATAVPIEVLEITRAVEVRAGKDHACARTPTGAVYCWGDNRDGQLGIGEQGPAAQGVPVEVPELHHAIALAAGDSHSCAVLPNGSARCWGRNEFGQLGDGTREARRSPTPVLIADDAAQIYAASAHTCVQRRNEAVVCFGNGELGQLGDRVLTQTAAPEPFRIDLETIPTWLDADRGPLREAEREECREDVRHPERVIERNKIVVAEEPDFGPNPIECDLITATTPPGGEIELRHEAFAGITRRLELPQVLVGDRVIPDLTYVGDVVRGNLPRDLREGGLVTIALGDRRGPCGVLEVQGRGKRPTKER
jgi:hypothetical protein